MIEFALFCICFFVLFRYVLLVCLLVLFCFCFVLFCFLFFVFCFVCWFVCFVFQGSKSDGESSDQC